MKEFKLYVGQWEDNMTEVLHAGLKNDPIPETFTIRSVNDAGLAFHTQFIKIEPLSYDLLHSDSKHPDLIRLMQGSWLQFSYLNMVCTAERNKRRTVHGKSST